MRAPAKIPNARRRLALLSVLPVAAGFALAPSVARANGRFPRSERLIIDPVDSGHWLLAATYGLLTTPDRGAHWYDFCEAQFAGDSAYGGDPLVDFVGGVSGSPSAVLADVQAALTRSADFCRWAPTLGAFGSSDNINDFAVDRSTGKTVVAVVTSLAEGGFRIGLEESTDFGASFHAIGSPLPLASVATIDLAPGDPTHIYATGLARGDAGQVGAFLQSLDHGATWSVAPIPGTDTQNVPYIAAIDPHDANRIFVRTDSFITPADAPEESANDALLVSTDGGKTWREVLRQTAKLLGFAIAPDGSAVLAGYGDPVEAASFVDPAATGIYLAKGSDLAFAPIYAGSVTCLTWTTDGVYACTAQPASGSLEELAFFRDGDLAPDAGAPTYVMQLGDVLGPTPCCPAAQAACPWDALCSTYPFFSCGADAGTAAASCAPDGGASTPGDGGKETGTGAGADAGGTPGGASSASDGGSFDAASAKTGCACRAAPVDARAEGFSVLAAAALSAAGLRRRRRPRSPR